MYFLTFFSGGCKSEVSVSEEWVSLKASLIDLEMTALALHNLLLVHKLNITCLHWLIVAPQKEGMRRTLKVQQSSLVNRICIK